MIAAVLLWLTIPAIRTTYVCSPGEPAPGCQYMCHCTRTKYCGNRQECQNNCDAGWTGAECQFVNVAYGTDAWQTNTFLDYRANLAVDGNRDNNRSRGSCSNTMWNTADDKIWRTDLGGQHWIEYLTVYNRGDSQDPSELAYFEVYVGKTSSLSNSTLCYKEKNKIPGLVIDIRCGDVIKGRFVTILLKKAPLEFYVQLALCEVEVFGGRNVAFGRPVQIFHKTQNASVDVTNLRGYSDNLVDGQLQLSPPGIYKTDASMSFVISLGKKYKILRIRLHFNGKGGFAGHLALSTFLDYDKHAAIWTMTTEDGDAVLTGSYVSMSVDTPHLADTISIVMTTIELTEVEVFAECADGYFGLDCTRICRCAHNASCDVHSGVCSGGCQLGYEGPNCQWLICADGTYGSDCSSHCASGCVNGTCDRHTGVCGCKPGYTGTTCSQKCSNDTYGENCTSPCPDGCHQGSCHHVSGACAVGCSAGLTGPFCNETCDDQHWGENCRLDCECPRNTGCNPISGHCSKSCSPSNFRARGSSYDESGHFSTLNIVLFVIIAAFILLQLTTFAVLIRQRSSLKAYRRIERNDGQIGLNT